MVITSQESQKEEELGEMLQTPDGLKFQLSDVKAWTETPDGLVCVGRIGNYAVIGMRTKAEAAWGYQVVTKERLDHLMQHIKAGEFDS